MLPKLKAVVAAFKLIKQNWVTNVRSIYSYLYKEVAYTHASLSQKTPAREIRRIKTEKQPGTKVTTPCWLCVLARFAVHVGVLVPQCLGSIHLVVEVVLTIIKIPVPAYNSLMVAPCLSMLQSRTQSTDPVSVVQKSADCADRGFIESYWVLSQKNNHLVWRCLANDGLASSQYWARTAEAQAGGQHCTNSGSGRPH